MVELIKSNTFTIYLVFGALLFLSSCECRSVCSCINIGFEIEYQDNTGNCSLDNESILSIQAFDLNNNELDLPYVGESSTCDVYINYLENQYWIIQSDNLEISDTLRVENLVTRSSDDPCCACSSIESVLYSVNSISYSSANITRLY